LTNFYFGVPTDPAELSYIAAMIDGEGCLTFSSRRGRKHQTTYPCLWIANTDARLMTWLTKKVGGRVYRVPRTNPRWKMGYQWGLTRQAHLILLLEAVIPYLLLKRDKAEAIVADLKQRPNYRGLTYNARLTPEQVREIRQRMQAGEKQRDLALEFDIGESSISYIKSGRLYRGIAS
jgi:hypothetical protein